MRISVIIPAYNASEYIGRCLNSVLGSADEVLVVDDGSLDTTADQVRTLQESWPSLKLVSQKNRGVSAARNVGLDLCDGDYVVWLDADDYLEEEAISRLRVVLADCRSDIIVMRSFASGVERYPWAGKENEHYLRGSVCGCAFKRSFLIENSLRFRESVRLSEDLLFFGELLCKRASLSFWDIVFYQVYLRPDSASRNISDYNITGLGQALKLSRDVLTDKTIRRKVCLAILLRISEIGADLGYSARQTLSLGSLDKAMCRNRADSFLFTLAYPLLFTLKRWKNKLLSSLMAVFFLLSFPLGLQAESVYVSSQEELMSLGARISELLSSGERIIDVSFAPGIYFFPENCIKLFSVDASGARITIDGNGASFIGEGRVCCDGDDVGYYSFETGWTDLRDLSPMDMLGPVRLARFFPVPTSFSATSFRIPAHEPDMSPEQAKDVYIIVTQWYKGVRYKVDKIRHGWIYYHEEEPSPTKWYTELRYGRCLPRYQLLNQPDSSFSIRDGRLRTDNEVYRSDASCFFYAKDCRLGSILINNCRFEGNNGESPLFYFNSVITDSTVVSACHFRGIRGEGIILNGTPRVIFCGNEARQNYRSIVSSDMFSSHTCVRNNRFLDNGYAFSNNMLVFCMGGDMLIADNYFEDFTYAAIGVGAHYSLDCGEITSGLVYGNEICHTPEFRKKPMRSIIDGGAIYIYTQNKNIVISGNYVHDIGGHHGNRGIFGDDGVNNVTVSSNLVLGIENSYPIDLRHYEKVSRMPRSHVRRGNLANRIVDNVVDAKCRLFVRKDDHASEISNNTVLKETLDREEALCLWKRMKNDLAL